MIVRVHFILDDPPLQRRLRRLFRGQDLVISGETEIPGGAGDADVTIVRESLWEGRLSELVTQLRASSQGSDLVVITASEDPTHRSRLLGQGVAAVLGEADPDSVLGAALTHLVSTRAELMRLAQRAESSSRFGSLAELSSESPGMAAFYRVVHKVIPSETTLLIEGETGVGKERLARIIHAEGPRGAHPFIAVNCAAIPDALLESELFGHEQGAFTDAVRQKRGKFELAHGGTIFLDEVGDMPLHLQAKLLRVLQEREIERVGGEEALSIDVRVLAATNQDLEDAVRDGRFRADLFYRLAVLTLRLPPLRERPEDIPGLVQRFVNRFAGTLKKGALSVDAVALDALIRYEWPGNVRELINVIERAVLLADSSVLGLAELPEIVGESARLGILRDPVPSRVHDEDLMEIPWNRARDLIVARFERAYLAAALARTEGRVGDAARQIGINPRSLYEKMRRLELDKRDFRQPTPDPARVSHPASDA